MKERDSNIELLRIIATLFIMMLHCNGWMLSEYGGVDSWFAHGNAIGISRVNIQNITVLGVDLFILISGFYGLRPKLKSIVNMFTLLLFFYVGCYSWNCVLGHDTFAWSNFGSNFLAFSRANWFINSYLFIMLLSPLINAFANSVSTRQLGFYTLIYCLLTIYFGSIVNNQYWWYNGGYSVVMMIGVYLVGRCLSRITEKIESIKYRYLVLAFVVLIAIMSIIRIFASDEEAWLNYGSPITIIAASVFFMLFYRMPKFHSKVINWIGSSCLAAYVLHTCYPMFPWLIRKDVSFLNDAYPLYCIKISAVIGGIFVLAILLDKVRMLLFKPLINWSGKIKMLN